MKVAHLILAHKNPQQLQRLIASLEHPAFFFFIHLDKKTDAAPFTAVLKNRNVFFLEDRVNIKWGGWGTIQATLNGFKAITGKGYDYINVISGQDFPIKPAHSIHEYFQANAGFEFITCDSVDGKWENVGSRIKRYHFINWKIPGKFRIEKIANKFLPARKFPLDFHLVGRANWFTLTQEAVKYILDFLPANPAVTRYFKYCWGADEFIFSTILFNSSFRNKICDSLMYVQWSDTSSGHPDVLTTTDFQLLKNSNKLFARKFDMQTQPEVLALLEQTNAEEPEVQQGL